METNKRIYSYFSKEEYDLVVKAADEISLSPSAYMKYKVLLDLMPKEHKDPTLCWKELQNNLNKLPAGKTFIVSTLLPEIWPSLSRSTKMTLALKLSKESYKSELYEKYDMTNNRTPITIYIKK